MNKHDPLKPISTEGRLHTSTPHDSAAKQVAGRADYVDDLAEPEGMLHAYLGLSTKAHAEIASIDLEAVRNFPGVVGILTAADIPGENDISSVHKQRYQLGAQA
jgi:xanthine dehydrogenase large subunit